VLSECDTINVSVKIIEEYCCGHNYTPESYFVDQSKLSEQYTVNEFTSVKNDSKKAKSGV
jgi:hypothetical protein